MNQKILIIGLFVMMLMGFVILPDRELFASATGLPVAAGGVQTLDPEVDGGWAAAGEGNGEWSEWAIQLAQAPMPTEIRVDGIEIIEYGIFDAKKFGDISKPETTLGKIGVYDFDSLVLIQETKKVMATLNTKFGLRYKLKGSPLGRAIPIMVKVLSPGIKSPYSSRVKYEETWTDEKNIGAAQYDGFIFENDWEMVPGKWVIQIFYGSKKLGEQEFEVDKEAKEAKEAEKPLLSVSPTGGPLSYVDEEIEKLSSSDCETRLAAVYQLKSLGNEAAPAIPALIRNLRTYSMPYQIDFDCGAGKATPDVLAGFGERAIQPLIASLGEPLWNINAGVKEALVKMGPAATGPLLQALKENSDWNVRVGATEVLTMIKDERAVPPLVEIMQSDPQAEIRGVVINAFAEWKDQRTIKPLMEIYTKKSEPMMVRYLALTTLKKIGCQKEMKSLLPVLYSEEEPDLKEAIIESLEKIKERSVTEYLLKCLNDEKAPIRASAVLTLGKQKYGNLAPLLKPSVDPDKYVRKNTAFALGESGNQKAVTILMALLNDTDGSVQVEAIRALAKLKASKAVDPLMRILKSDNNDEIRIAINNALGDIGDSRAVGVILPFLDSKSSYIQESALKTLGRLKAVEAVSPLIAMIKKEYDKSYNVAKALAEIGGPAVKPLLEACRGETRHGVRLHIIEALSKMVDFPVNDMIAALKDQDMYVVEVAAVLLGKTKEDRAVISLVEKLDESKKQNAYPFTQALGNIGGPAIVPLLERLKQENQLHKADIIQALGVAQDKRAVEPLILVLEKGDDFLNQYTTRALGQIGDKKAVEPLIKALKGKSDSVRGGAAEALGKIGDQRAFDPLMELLKSDPKTRFYSIEALGRLKNKRAIKAVNIFLKDQDMQLRRRACATLGEIADKDAVECLIEALNDNDKETSFEARKALTRISKMNFGYQVAEWKKWLEREKRKMEPQ